jgi:hypothetical protein
MGVILLAGNYSLESVVTDRNRYYTHRTIDEDVTRGLIDQEEMLHRGSQLLKIVFPRWIWRLIIYGMFRCPLTCVPPNTLDSYLCSE